jgi:prohibitin 1
MAGAAGEKLASAVMRGGFGIASLAAIPTFVLYNVDGGQRVVMLNMFTGVDEKVRGEGTHFRIPWVMQPKKYNITVKPKKIETSTGTKDLQNVSIHVRLLYRPDIEGLPQIHKTLGEDFAERVLPSIANEIMKATVAQYNAEQLLTQRESVSHEIRDGIVQRAKQFNILVDDVSITHLTYGKEFSLAIERKQVAEQEAERQKFVVQRVEQERQATVIRSEGEAEAAKLISQALAEHGNGLIEVRRIDAAKDIADMLSKSPNVMYLPQGQSMLLNMSGGQRSQ